MRERMPNSIKALAIALGFDVIAYWICLTFLDLQDATMALVTMVAAVVEMALIILGAVIVIRDKKKRWKKAQKKRTAFQRRTDVAYGGDHVAWR